MKIILSFIALLSITLNCKSQSISISPSSAQAGQTLNVSITGTGTHFATGSNTTLAFGFDQCSSTTLNSFSIINDHSITANISIPSTNLIYNNLHDIEVFNPFDGFVIADHVFDISGGNNYPITISPDSGLPGQTLNVTITGNGTHFMQGSGSLVDCFLDFNQEACNNSGPQFLCNPSSNTVMTGSFTIPPITASGYYDLSIYDGFDYFGTLQNLFHVIGNVGINELENEYKLEISPNPFSQQMILNYRITHPENVSVEIYDVVGRKVFLKRTDNQSTGLHSEIIDAALLNLRPGIYLLQFSPGDRTITKRILFVD